MKATHKPPTLDHQPDATPAELLHGAAAYLRRHGWIQGDFFDLLTDEAFPPACAMGAINVCAHGRPTLGSDDTADDTLTDAAIRAKRVLAAYLDPEYLTDGLLHERSAIDIIGDWNDQDGMTTELVAASLDDAADDWDRLHTTGGAR
ncbi:hypothetical protein [Krasilnikovia sp. MM14-A1004]|uniref:DUF6197 family protein n=1 Tax=Krasilnikovia sp. MM14-A1004 TaxID=3373541 RepID=UPI00399C7192